MTEFETLGKATRELIREQNALLRETADEAERGAIYARLDELFAIMDRLIDQAIDARKPEYDAALRAASEAVEEVRSARRRIQEVVKAMKVVDDFVKAAIKLLGVLA